MAPGLCNLCVVDAEQATGGSLMWSGADGATLLLAFIGSLKRVSQPPGN